jgi:betaine-aldehyde dehydrogenase
MSVREPHSPQTAIDCLERYSGAYICANAWRASASDVRLSVINPATEEAIAAIADLDDEEVDACLAAAAGAWRPWFRMSALERTTALHGVAQEIRRDQRLIAELMTLEMGKPFKEAMDEIDWSITAIDYYAEVSRHENGRVLGNTVPGQLHLVTKEPLGVVGIIMPFNYPLVLLAWEAAAALAAGNAIVVKPSEVTSITTLRFLECFRALPAGVVNCITGGPRVGSRLVASPLSNMIAFTGSVNTGRAVARTCAESFKRCLIEASGNDAFIVMPSAKLDAAVRGAAFAAFLNCGQVCTSAERILVHESIHDRFVERLAEEARRLRIGNGLDRVDVGPMASRRELERFEAVLARAIEQGAHVVCGGRRPANQARGYYFEPTVLADVRPEMDIMKHEPFGPVAPVCKVSSFDEAIAIANASEYGLGANVYTSDLEEAARAVSELETGMVWVNAPLLDNAAGPFGGRKRSGIGRQLGSEGLDAFRETKLSMIDPGSSHQDFWWFPYQDSESFRG